jgi:exodeoxyribonuclease VII large subunit
MLGDYIGRLGRVWVEGQIVSLRQYGRQVYITLRDPDVEMSMSVVAPADAINSVEPEIGQGSRVVLQASVEWWAKNGSLQLRAHSVQAVGVGDLLARIELLRRNLEAEGLFRTELKRPVPFLPRTVGLITGRDTDALKDVVINARRRWPATRFEIREIALQQAGTPQAAIQAMNELAAIADVDVIVFARGGGSFEDLLPWSDELLVRAVRQCPKPVVSAIGHENDRPILDDVADLRASTPTDAAGKIVPDLEDENARFTRNAARMRDLKTRWLTNATHRLDLAQRALRAHSPRDLINLRIAETTMLTTSMKQTVQRRINREQNEVARLASTLTALSPFKVLARGYSVATDNQGNVVRDISGVTPGSTLHVQVSDGHITTLVESTEKSAP